MAVTAFPTAVEAPDITLLNVARLFTRLEHNLLSPSAELRTLRNSEFQRIRVTKNVEYARTLLSQLERSLPQLKQPDRRHEAQAEIARDRQLLKRMETLLAEEDVRASTHNDETDDEADGEWADLLSRPIGPSKTLTTNQQETQTTSTTRQQTTSTISATTAPPAPTTASEPPSTLRNRQTPLAQTPTDPSTAKTSGSNANPDSRLGDSEEALSAERLEQEDLTSSLLSLAGQLKASSKSFQTTLENEQSVLDRAVTGMDKTSTTMEAAGKRMGMLRRMTEGKGWWGRMMLYAWIFGLWLVAVLIVFLGPKLRF